MVGREGEQMPWAGGGIDASCHLGRSMKKLGEEASVATSKAASQSEVATKHHLPLLGGVVALGSFMRPLGDGSWRQSPTPAQDDLWEEH